MIDVHCHISISFYNNEENPLKKMVEKIVSGVIVIDSVAHPKDFDYSLELQQRFPNRFFVSVGLHPTEIFNLSEEEIENLKNKIVENREKIVAIGEIGLDYYYFKEKEEIKKQKEIFYEFLELALKLKKPVVLHLRNSIEEGFEIIKSYNVKKAVFHFFTGKWDLAQKIVNEGYFLSIPAIIKKSKTIKKTVKKVGLENLLAETDSPWASPFNEKFNTPLNVKVVYQQFSEIKKIDFEDVEKIVDENAKKIFDLPI